MGFWEGRREGAYILVIDWVLLGMGWHGMGGMSCCMYVWGFSYYFSSIPILLGWVCIMEWISSAKLTSLTVLCVQDCWLSLLLVPGRSFVSISITRDSCKGTLRTKHHAPMRKFNRQMSFSRMERQGVPQNANGLNMQCIPDHRHLISFWIFWTGERGGDFIRSLGSY